jgi:hypothetical protein
MNGPHPLIQGILEAHGAPAPRMARCRCGYTRPSSERATLFGFTDMSLSSDWLQKSCRHCGKYEVAHHPGCSQAQPNMYERHQFEPRNEAAEFDTFYCGCDGWE